MASLRQGIERLTATFTRLRQQWRQTTNQWDDPVGREFQKRELEPIALQTQNVHRKSERLASIIDQAKRNIK